MSFFERSRPARLLRLLLAALFILPLTGCFSGSVASMRSSRLSNAQLVATPDVPRTTITWAVWGEPWELEIDRRLARSFEAEQPTIRVEIVTQPGSLYGDWLEREWSQGRSPDVALLDNVRGHAAQGRLEPLDRYMTQDLYDLSDFHPRLLSLFNSGGRYYGLPRDNDTKVIYYNTSMLADAGLRPPRRDWTWDDLREMAQKLTRRTPDGRPTVYGFAFETAGAWRLWVWQNGGELFDNPFQPERVTIGDPSAREALRFLRNLILVDRVTPPYEEMQTSSQIADLFRNGRVAMAFGGHDLIPALAEELSLKWNVATLPRGKERANLAGGNGYAIPRLAEHKDAAWALVKYLESPRGQAIFAESGILVPARSSVREDNIFLRRQPYDAQVFVEESEFGRANLNNRLAPELNRLMEWALLPVWRGETGVDAAINELVPRLERAIAP